MSESRPLLDTQTIASAAGVGAGFANQAADKIQKARADGPLTFRVLGLIGGLGMIVSNGIAVLDRFFSFNFTGAMIALYGILFGIIITMLEGPGPCSSRLGGAVRYYAKFLEFTWGRGALYFFVGSLQASNWNMLDWAVGGFMMFVGVTAIGVGISSARQLRLLRLNLKDEPNLRRQWALHDTDKSNTLDVKELTAFCRDAGLDISRNELAAIFLALDKNFDDKIAYEELFAWFSAEGAYGGSRFAV